MHLVQGQLLPVRCSMAPLTAQALQAVEEVFPTLCTLWPRDDALEALQALFNRQEQPLNLLAAATAAPDSGTQVSKQCMCFGGSACVACGPAMQLRVPDLSCSRQNGRVQQCALHSCERCFYCHCCWC